MIKINQRNAKIYSRLGQNGSVFGIGLITAQKEGSNIYVISADMSEPVGLRRFKALYPENFINIGIAEQNMLGVAAGMVSENKKVIVDAQACFLSMRSCEQMRQFMGYMQQNIIAIGISAGFALTFFGNTHYALEDVSIIRSIPDITIVSPSDAGQAIKALIAAIGLNQPIYLRLTGTLNCPIIYTDDYNFKIGQGIEIKKGTNLTIFATGSMVSHSIEVSKLIEEKGYSVSIIDMHTIKPLDTKLIEKYFASSLYVTIEEHNIIGGLGTAIAEYLSLHRDSPPLLRLGVNDEFSHPGDYFHLLKENRLMPEQIAEDILKELKLRIIKS